MSINTEENTLNSNNIETSTTIENDTEKQTSNNTEINHENIEESSNAGPQSIDEPKHEKHNLDRKIIGNAISAYLLIGVSSIFLFNKKDSNINNSFVAAHTKSALVLHLGFLFTYIIFINIGLGKQIEIISSYGLNNIISILLFLGLFSALVYGMYKAHLGKYFLLGKLIKIPEMERFSEEEDVNISINEKNKLIVILSFIPFVGYYFYGEHKDKKLIRNTTKFNMISFILILLLFISNNDVWGSLLLLLYIIFSVYSILNLITKNEIPHIKLNFLLSPEDKFLVLKGLKKYLNAFRKKEKFITFKEILKTEKEKYDLEENEILKEIETKNVTKFPKELIYIPFVNLIFLFNKNTKYTYHIRNGLTITFLILITSIIPKVSLLNIFFLFPIVYGTGYLKTRLAYRMPFIYWVYEKSLIVFSLGLSKAKKVKEMKDKNKDIKLQVKESKKTETTIENKNSVTKKEELKDFNTNDFVEVKQESVKNEPKKENKFDSLQSDDFIIEENK